MIDWKRVQALHDEVGAEDFEEIVELFMEEVEDVLVRITASISQDRLGEDLHSLKGSGLNLGFSEFCALCQAGETAAEAGQAEIIDIEAIIQLFSITKQKFLENLSQLASA